MPITLLLTQLGIKKHEFMKKVICRLNIHIDHPSNYEQNVLLCFYLNLHRLPHVKHIYYEGKNDDILRSNPFITSYKDLIDLGHHISDEELQKARDATQPEHIAQLAFSTVSKIPRKLLHMTAKRLRKRLLQCIIV